MTPGDERRPASEPVASSAPSGSTPEGAAAGGQPPAAAEAPPTVRARGASRVFSVYTIIAAGLALLVITLFADAGRATLPNAIVGVLIVALGALAIADLADRRVLGWIGMIGAVPLGISGLVVSPSGLPEVARLLAGAVLFMGSVGLLSATMSAAHGEQEPNPRVEAS